MPKKKVEAPKRTITKRQMTQWQRQNRMRRFILICGFGVIAIVIALGGFAIYDTIFKQNRQIVFKVGDTSYNMGYFLDAVDYYGAINYAYLQSMGVDYSQFLSFYISSFANTIQENQILKETAAKLDPPVVVSEDEIDKYIQENKLKNNRAVRDAVYGALLDEKLTDKFDKQLPESAEHRAVLAMFLESQSQVNSVLNRIEKGESFHDLAEALSLDSTTKNKSGDLGWVPRGVIPTVLFEADNLILDDLVFNPDTKVNVFTQVEDKNKSKSMGWWLIQIVEIKEATASATAATPTPTPTATADSAGGKQIKVNVMLLGSEEKALEMKKQLEQGADFAELAKANSLYEKAAEDGGALGFISKGTLGTAVDAVLFPEESASTPAVGAITGPISDEDRSTQGGFWLAQVTGIETKALDGTNRSTLANIAKQEWRTTTWTENSNRVVDLLDQEKINYATTQALKRFEQN
ncbi:MAG TPA: peptidylprolyl isomerase [Dehalococcoidales bacterium]|nr:peptidylprolyl isomerase [Dehalococcoidales bacterium]